MAGFVFDLVGIEAILKDWLELREELREDEGIGFPMAHVIGPGDEPASWGAAGHAARSGELFLEHNLAMRGVVDQYITALTASWHDYLGADEAGRDSYPRR